MNATRNVTARQKQYVWLMGSHPNKIAVQGRGSRSRELRYGVSDEELVIFGYGEPFLFLRCRGLARPMANYPRGYALTDAGQALYNRLLLAGFGAGAPIRQVKVGAKTA